MLAMTFPGQGSQALGMLADLAAVRPVVRSTFDEASEVLGYDLWRLCQEGPEERLGETVHTQPAMLAAGVAVWRAWRDAGGTAPGICAGHSLGELSALVCAGAIEFPAAVALVADRARFMQEAVPVGAGGIAAVLGLDDAAVEAVCAEVRAADPTRHVSAVNFNAPGQVVVAGHAAAVERAASLARERGARRVVALPMSVPVHCVLMEPAAGRFRESLARAPIAAPRVPVVHNADLETRTDPDEIREALARQLVRPVRWTDTVRRLAAAGATRFVELGPGRVLTGLLRRIDRSVEGFAVHDEPSLRAALEACA